MNEKSTKEKGKKFLIIGLIFSPSIPLVVYRLTEGLNGLNNAGLGTMEFLLLPIYSALVITSVIFIGKGVELLLKK